MSILLACVALYAVALAAIALGQRRLLYFPYARVVAPALAGLGPASDKTTAVWPSSTNHAAVAVATPCEPAPVRIQVEDPDDQAGGGERDMTENHRCA